MHLLTPVPSLQVLLLSQDYGKHLLGVEDLLQKHALVEAHISVQAERVKAVSSSANRHAAPGEGERCPRTSSRTSPRTSSPRLMASPPQATSPATPR